MERDDLIVMDVKTRGKNFLTLSLVRYAEPSYNLYRHMSYPVRDRFAIDLGYYSLIIELWFIRSQRR